MNVRRFRAAVVAAMCAVALTAACSSSGGSSKAGGASSGSPSFTGADIVIGTLGAFSGALGSNEAGIPKAANAWASSVNASGGLKGHRVRIVTKDIGNETGADITAAKALVSQNHVAAIFDFDTEDAAWLPYTQSNGVPVISFTSAGSQSSPAAFPISIAQSAFAYALPSLAKTAGPKLGIVYCAEVPSCGGLGSLFKSYAGPLGLQIPVNIKISSSAPDYTAACQQLKNAGVDSYVVIAGSAVLAKLADQCHQQGLKAVLVQNAAQSIPAWTTDPAFNGLLVVDNFAPFFADNTPAHKAYRDALKTYTADMVNSVTDNAYSEASYLDGMLVSAAAKNVAGDLTAKTLKDALYTLKGETLGGMIQPVAYQQGNATVLGCYFSWTVKNGQRVAGNGDNYSCAPASVLDKIRSGG
jgi:branched-chain amino acid transport system substrate-binding protein